MEEIKMSNNEKQLVERIKEEYSEKQPNKVDELLTLNNQVKRPAEIFAYTFGTVGSLILGTGMSLAMKVIGASLSFAMPLGIAVGVVGLAMVGVNYFLYQKILKRRKAKYSKKILALTDELLVDKQ